MRVDLPFKTSLNWIQKAKNITIFRMRFLDRDHSYITSAKITVWVQKMEVFADIQYSIYV